MDHLETLVRMILPILNTLVWPLIALAALLIYRKSIEALLGRITSAKWKDVEIRFDQPRLPPPPAPVCINATISPPAGAICAAGGRLVLKQVSDFLPIGLNDPYPALRFRQNAYYYTQGETATPLPLRFL
jgi:hypothetical protein